MKQTKYLLLVFAVSFLANCKSPVSPQGTPKITFFSPKDTSLTDFLHITFHFTVENNGHPNLGLQWNFSDGKNETTNASIGIHGHLFPGLGNYTFRVFLVDTNSKMVFDTLLGSVHISYTSSRIRFFSPKDTLLIDSLRVTFHLSVDTINQSRNKLYWNFSDGFSDVTNVSINSYYHNFSSPGDYSFSVKLIGSLSTDILDSVSGMIHIPEPLLTLAELQQMKYFKVQIYCPVHHTFYDYTTYRTVTKDEIDFFEIDPIVLQDGAISPYAVDSLGVTDGVINWIGDQFNMNKSKGVSNGLGGGILWNVIGVVNEKKLTIDSFVLDHEFQNKIRWGNHAPMAMSLSKQANIVSIPFLGKDSDSLIFQEQKSDSLITLKNVYYGGENSYSMPPPFKFSGPTWNSLYSESYVRIILYK